LNTVKDIAGENYSKDKMQREIDRVKSELTTTERPDEQTRKQAEVTVKTLEIEQQRLDNTLEMKKHDLNYSLEMRDCFNSLLK
jgi:hypothetical protein